MPSGRDKLLTMNPLLIVTPQPGFGALIRKGLDARREDILVTADFADAIQFVRKANCSLAILDAELNDADISILDIGRALREINGNIQFVIVTRSGQDTQTTELSPLGILSKPIALPELQKLLGKAVPAPAPIPEAPQTPIIESDTSERLLAETSNLMWLKDVSKAAQHLTRMTLESSAQAALITREKELWAYAGQLSREAAQELARSIDRYWDKKTDSDLMSFVRLTATDAQHMLYARKLSNSMILALVFDAEIPFSTIRSQAGKLVRSLAESNIFEAEDSKIEAESAAPAREAIVEAEDDEEDDMPPISALLGDVPPPIPIRPLTTPKISTAWEQPKSVPVQPALIANKPKTMPPPRWASSVPGNPLMPTFSRESSPPIPVAAAKYPEANMAETRVSKSRQLETDTETRTDEIPNDVQVTNKHDPEKDIQTVIETRPQAISESVTEVVNRLLLEPASPALVNLMYACLLIPRFDHHILVGDAADRLTEWVPQVCVAFGWRLEHLAVRPEYLQWVVRVPPSTAPGFVIRIIRQQTSEKFFTEFLRFKNDNPSGDFWAPGYLIMGSSQPHPQTLVRDFIHQTRERQGIIR